MPGDADPDEWAKENLAGPPPPPKSSGSSSTNTMGSNAMSTSSNLEGVVAPPDPRGLSSAPQTPLPTQVLGTPAVGPGRVTAKGAASRKGARSRYVDTFNTDDGAPTDRDMMPPPARPRPTAPAYNIFTPKKAPDANGQ